MSHKPLEPTLPFVLAQQATASNGTRKHLRSSYADSEIFETVLSAFFVELQLKSENFYEEDVAE